MPAGMLGTSWDWASGAGASASGAFLLRLKREGMFARRRGRSNECGVQKSKKGSSGERAGTRGFIAESNS